MKTEDDESNVVGLLTKHIAAVSSRMQGVMLHQLAAEVLPPRRPMRLRSAPLPRHGATRLNVHDPSQVLNLGHVYVPRNEFGKNKAA